jgi:hypothetical protein
MVLKSQAGSNPQRPMTGGDFTEPIELKPFYIEGGLGRPIKDLILPMLENDAAARPTPAQLVAPWQDLFLEAAKRAIALEGRVV